MIIIYIRESTINSIDVILPYANMVFDPRIIFYQQMRGYTFSFSVNGRTLTVTRTDDDKDQEGWFYGFNLRAYLPTEEIPDFTSTVCTYWGLDDEEVPEDTTEVIFHPSVRTIQEQAFDGCTYNTGCRHTD